MTDSADEGVTVCIPTYRRPELLIDCICSVFANSFRPIQIVVSDDEADSQTEDLLSRVRLPPGVRLTYVRNRLSPGQSGNVNNAILNSDHEKLILIHDDDFFVPGGIDELCQIWKNHKGCIDAAFGRQFIADHEGRTDHATTEKNNSKYFKNEPEGVLSDKIVSALLRQFPNNGFLFRRSIARSIGYPAEEEVGRIPVDFHFGLRYAEASKRPFIFTRSYISVYRLSRNSVARSRHEVPEIDGHIGFEQLENFNVATAAQLRAKEVALSLYAPAAVRGYIHNRANKRALLVYLRHVGSMGISILGKLRLFTILLMSFLGIRLL